MEDINNKCKEEGCNKKATHRGYCNKHYSRHKRDGRFEGITISHQKDFKCKVENCSSSSRSLGFCHNHYKLFKRNGNPETIKTHGMSHYKEYNVWETMKARCNNSNVKAYKYYGARGIKVCDRWMQGIENFYSDMGRRPSDKHDIDRIDSKGNYEPSNCRWATKTENSRNRACVKMSVETVAALRLDRKNTDLSFSKLGEKYGISKSAAMRICQNKIWRV